ncbi:hypothetical protein GOV11_04845 [Candidatus Woesearchaeota archaeon]|nr:hypothetical protein [Candidatus Woesearchaeota archaeon]
MERVVLRMIGCVSSRSATLLKETRTSLIVKDPTRGIHVIDKKEFNWVILVTIDTETLEPECDGCEHPRYW